MVHISKTILDTIGNTPLIPIDHLFIKCEFTNPSGSIKARVAKFLVERAEQEGRLRPGDTIVEATSGNMGNALAMIAAVKGYKMLVLTLEDFSQERVALSQAYGAEVRFVGKHNLSEAVALAKKIGSEKGYFCPSQFDNPGNIEENARWLGTEIIEQLPPGVRIDAIVQGVGTGGTLIGVGKAFREKHNPNIKLFAVEPAESTTIQTGQVGPHQIEGISDGFIPELFLKNQHDVYGVISIKSDEALTCMHWLAAKHGLFVGPSSGANYLAAQEIRRRDPEVKNVLTFFCDEGEKYIIQHFRNPHLKAIHAKSCC